MNDLVIQLSEHSRAITRDRADDRASDNKVKNGDKHRRRLGGRLFALGGFSLLAGGLALGAWVNYSQQQEVAATGRQKRDFIPSVRVATIEASPATVLVTLPGTTAALAAANIYARATG